MAVVKNLDRIGMRQPRSRLDLALESRERQRVGSRLGLDELERARSLEHLVLGQVDLAHPAFANFLDQAILAQAASRVKLGAESV